MDVNKTIGENLYNLRKEKKWSQETVAEELDLSVDTYKRLEYGITSLRVDKIPTICNVFDTTIYAILPAEMFTGSQNQLLRDLATIISKMRTK